jgi:hypothetical protein
MHFATRVRIWRVARLYGYSVLYSEIALSQKQEENTCTYTVFCLEWPILRPPGILTFPTGMLYIYFHLFTKSLVTTFGFMKTKVRKSITRLLCLVLLIHNLLETKLSVIVVDVFRFWFL